MKNDDKNDVNINEMMRYCQHESWCEPSYHILILLLKRKTNFHLPLTLRIIMDMNSYENFTDNVMTRQLVDRKLQFSPPMIWMETRLQLARDLTPCHMIRKDQ